MKKDRLTYRAYRESEPAKRLAETIGKDKTYSLLLGAILENWLSPSPISSAIFDVKYLRNDEALSLLKIHAATIENSHYRPTAFGIALSIAVSAKGAVSFGHKCSKGYDWLRRLYLNQPENPQEKFEKFLEDTKIDRHTAYKVLTILRDVSGCGATTTSQIHVNPTIRTQESIWTAFEKIARAHAFPTNTNFGIDPWSGISEFPTQTSAEFSMIKICPEAYDDLQKAYQRLEAEPDGAITSARSMLESCIKWIFHQKGKELPSNLMSAAKRVKECIKLLDADNDFEKPGVIQMVNGMVSAAQGLDEARNVMGDGHGKSPDAPKANRRIARLVVGFSVTTVAFLLSTYESRQRP